MIDDKHQKLIHEFKSPTYIKLKPNIKNLFIISKRNTHAFVSKAQQYVSLDPITDEMEGVYSLKYFISSKDFYREMQSNLFVEFGIFILEEDNTEKRVALRVAAFEGVKCLACHGRGSFATTRKVTYGEKAHTPGVEIAPVIANKVAYNAVNVTTCAYNHVRQIGCDGKGVDDTRLSHYQHLIKNMFPYSREEVLNWGIEVESIFIEPKEVPKKRGKKELN